VPIALWLASHPAPGAPPLRRYLVVGLIVLWGARLTWNWLRGWGGLHHEDWRYVDLRQKTGRAYWLVSFFGLHFMPTVTVFLGLVALAPALSGTAPLGPLDALAAAVTLGAVVLEAIADEQLRAFRHRPRADGSILDTGLWAWSRHPNYLGEISFWWGLFLFGVAGTQAIAWWTLPGPLWMTALFVFISVPMLDRRSLARRPAYAAHMKAVPGLLPRPWRRAGRRA
jgi:steroid 5-alpha reductase family enzyme